MGINQNKRLFNRPPSSQEIVSWKGLSIQEISLRSLQNQNQNTDKANIFLRPPIKLYRKETPYSGSGSRKVGTFRERQSLDDINRPGGLSVYQGSATMSAACLTNNPVIVLDPRPNIVNAYNQSNCNDATNARRRVRTSGNLTNAFNSRNQTSYCTSTKQYLESRQLSFDQNKFQYFRQGNSDNTPGSVFTKNNIYAAQGTTAQKYFLEADASFTYSFPVHAVVGSSAYVLTPRPVVVPGNRFYDINDLNQVLFAAMVNYGDVYVDPTYQTNHAYLSLSYNNVQNYIVITAYPVVYPSASGVVVYAPSSQQGQVAAYQYYPYISMDTSFFANWLGFPANSSSSFPSASDTTTAPANVGSVRVSTSSLPFSINPTTFKPVFYKPTNYQYAQDGGVSSSDRILRLRYNTIVTNASTYDSPYGGQVANALAYSVNDRVYSLKDQMGFPLTKSPHVDAITGEVRCCNSLALTVA